MGGDDVPNARSRQFYINTIVCLSKKGRKSNQPEYFQSKPVEAKGYCQADYNKKRMLDGKYKCISTVRTGFDEDVVDMSLENTYFPFGVHYTHQFEYSGGNEGTNLPTIVRYFLPIDPLEGRLSKHYQMLIRESL